MKYDELRPNMRLICTDTGTWTCIEPGKVYTINKSRSDGLCISCTYGVHRLSNHKSAGGYLLQFDKAAP